MARLLNAKDKVNIILTIDTSIYVHNKGNKDYDKGIVDEINNLAR